MELFTYLFLILIGIGAGFVQRVSGFGLGIFVMTFLPHMIPSQKAAAISCIYSCFTSAFNALRYRRNISFSTVLPMLAASLVTIPIAVHFSASVSQAFFQTLLGTVLIALSLYFLFFNRRLKIRPGIGGGFLAGAVSGILNGLFSTGGPPAVLYLSSVATDNLTYFATIQFFFAVNNVYSTAMRVLEKVIDGEVLVCSAVGLIGCMIGDLLGKRVFDRLDSEKMKKVIYVGMIVSGLVMLF